VRAQRYDKNAFVSYSNVKQPGEHVFAISRRLDSPTTTATLRFTISLSSAVMHDPARQATGKTR
jgi:hypothetical protein